MNYKTVENFGYGFRVVINGCKGIKQSEIDSIVGAIGYSAKAQLRMREEIYLSGQQILGDTLILDISCDMTKTNSDDIYARIPEFITQATKNVQKGILHKGSNTFLGGIGRKKVQFLEKDNRTKYIVETTLNIHELEDALSEDDATIKVFE